MEALYSLLEEAIETEVPQTFSPLRKEIVKLFKEVGVFRDVFEGASEMLENEKKRANYYIEVYETVINDLQRDTMQISSQVEDIIYSYMSMIPEFDGRSSIFSRTRSKNQVTSLEEKVRSIREGQLKSLLQRIKSIRNNGYPIRPYDYSPNTTQLRRSPAEEPPEVHNAVGLEEVNTLVEPLLQSKDFVYLITGMPGVGKTTLASRIFHHPTIKKEFDIIIWSSNFEDMIFTIWEKLSMPVDEVPMLPLDEEISNKIRKSLETKRFLIFLDDIAGTDEAWEKFQEVLPSDNEVSRVLITTSNLAMIEDMDPPPQTIKLQCMDECRGWELLHLQVYGKLDRNSDPELERFGKEIVKQCGGLPRAILLIGDVLKVKMSLVQGNKRATRKIWKEVADGVQDYLFDPKNPKSMENYISTFYNKLSYAGRGSLLLFCMFPEGSNPTLSQLSRLWSAEVTSEDDLYEGLNELLFMNLLTIGRWSSRDLITLFIHNLVQQFCKNKAKSGERYIFHPQEIKRSEKGAFEPPVEEMEKYRHLCIHSHVQDFLLEKPNLKKAQLFICFADDPVNLMNEHIESVAFEELKVFQAADTIKFPNFPDKLTQLVRLRYIRLAGDRINVLPKGITNWRCIHTIILKTKSSTLKINGSIWDMTQLRVLKTKAAIILKNDGDVKGKGCKKLETLSFLSTQSCIEQVAEMARRLSYLGIRGQLSNVLDSDFLGKLGKLGKLKLVNEELNNTKPAGTHRLHSLPQPNKFPPNLSELILSNTFLDWKHMSTIAELDLYRLKLKNNAFVGDQWSVVSGSFPLLYELCIDGTDLEIWFASGDSFPRLRRLSLRKCQKLEGIPLELGDGRYLEVLELTYVSAAAIVSAKEIERAIKQKGPKRSPLKLLTDIEDRLGTAGSKLFTIEDGPFGSVVSTAGSDKGANASDRANIMGF